MAISAAGYIRVSSSGQLKGHGPKRQREDIEAFARRNGYKIADWYTDDHTGTEADRPAFVEMLTAMIANGCRVVIVESLDRFARDLAVQMQLIAKMIAEGLTLIPANTGQIISSGTLDDNPMLRAMIAVQGVFAQLDKDLLVAKLKKGRAAVKKATKTKARPEGKCEGPRDFGGHDGEPAVLAHIKRLARKPRGGDRLTPTQIAKKLNVEQLPTRTGVPWSRQAVKRICVRNGWAEKST